MRQNFEQIFQEACQKLQQGFSKAEVLSVWPQYSRELEPVLDIFLALKTLPKKTVPEPSLRRKYILAPSKQFWLHWEHISRFAAVGTSVVLFLALGLTTGYAASVSVPGGTFFNLKKVAEHLQVQLAQNQADKISLQVGIAQKRLNDAQLALTDSKNDPAKETAALAELSAETTNSINALDQAAKDNNSPLSAKGGHPLAASLVNIASIASQQQTLVKNLNVGAQLDQTAKNALQATQDSVTKVAEITKSLETASNHNDLAKLDSNPSAVTASGSISSFTDNLLTVAENTFIVDGKTIIKNSDNNKIDSVNLAPKLTVIVVGDKTDAGLVARQITLLEKPQNLEGVVKGISAIISAASSTKATSTQAGDQDQSAINQDPNIATGSFIMEDPAPQTDFKR